MLPIYCNSNKDRIESQEFLRIGWIRLKMVSSSSGTNPFSNFSNDPVNKSTTRSNLDLPQALFSWLSGSSITISLLRTAKEKEQGQEVISIF